MSIDVVGVKILYTHPPNIRSFFSGVIKILEYGVCHGEELIKKRYWIRMVGGTAYGGYVEPYYLCYVAECRLYDMYIHTARHPTYCLY